MKRAYRSEILEHILQLLHTAVPGIIASVIVNKDGLLVSAFPPGNDASYDENPTSSPQVAAMSAVLISLAELTLRRLEQGDFKRLLIEGDDGVMVVYPAGRAALVMLVAHGTNMGQVLYAASRARNDIIKVLEN